MFTSNSIDEFYNYVYYNIVSIVTSLMEDVNSLSGELFSNEYISAIVGFFTLLAWALGLIGAVIAIMDFAVTYRTGGGGSFLGTGLSMFRLLLALTLFSTAPILLYMFCIDIYGVISSAVVMTMDGNNVSTGTLVEGAVQNMFQQTFKSLPPFRIISGVYDFWSKLLGGGSSGDSNWLALVQLCVVVYAVFKVFFGNLKRGAILFTQVCVGSLHMYNLARGYTDGFSSWCKQIVGVCFTAFLQNIMYLL